MKCPTCHIEYATREGFNAHIQSCGYKDNPLPEPEPEKAVETEKPKVKKATKQEDSGGE
jgi:hypothetical protein